MGLKNDLSWGARPERGPICVSTVHAGAVCAGTSSSVWMDFAVRDLKLSSLSRLQASGHVCCRQSPSRPAQFGSQLQARNATLEAMSHWDGFCWCGDGGHGSITAPYDKSGVRVRVASSVSTIPQIEFQSPTRVGRHTATFG